MAAAWQNGMALLRGIIIAAASCGSGASMAASAYRQNMASAANGM